MGRRTNGLAHRAPFDRWGLPSQTDAVRCRVLAVVAAVATPLVLFFFWKFEFWGPGHSSRLAMESLRSRDAQVVAGMNEDEVLSRLGSPVEEEEAPFDPNRRDGVTRAPFGACKRLRFRSRDSAITTVFLNADGRVLEVERGMQFDPVEYWN